MPTKLTSVKLTGTLDGSGDIDVKSANVFRGIIHAVRIDYPIANVAVDLLTDGPIVQTILDLAAASTDRTVYPRTPVHDLTGTAIDLSDAEGGNTAQYEKFAIHSRLNLVCASGTTGQEVTVHVLIEEY